MTTHLYVDCLLFTKLCYFKTHWTQKHSTLLHTRQTETSVLGCHTVELKTVEITQLQQIKTTAKKRKENTTNLFKSENQTLSKCLQ